MTKLGLYPSNSLNTERAVALLTLANMSGSCLLAMARVMPNPPKMDIPVTDAKKMPAVKETSQN